MTFQIVQGDLFDPEFEFHALAQGVNTHGIMGAGIAVQFAKRWPDMYEDYKARCTQFGPALGGLVHLWMPDDHTISLEALPDGTYDPAITFHEPIIFNMFSQVMPGKDGDYRLLQQAAIQVLFEAEGQGLESVGLPWIGCGIAGLAKHNVQHIFEQVFGESETHFVLVQQEPVA